jgi:hypothetical protein
MGYGKGAPDFLRHIHKLFAPQDFFGYILVKYPDFVLYSGYNNKDRKDYQSPR